MSVETVVEDVKQEVIQVVEEVKAVAKKVAPEISAEEKLVIREIENSYLKSQIEIQRLSQITQKAQADFTKTVEDLTKRYAIDPAQWLFDNVTLSFRKK